MQNRIKVTNSEGTSIFINTDHIVWVRSIANDTKGTAKIKVVTGDEMTTKESVEVVLGLIDDSASQAKLRYTIGQSSVA